LIEFVSESAALRAIDTMDGHIFDGTRIHVRLAFKPSHGGEIASTMAPDLNPSEEQKRQIRKAIIEYEINTETNVKLA
jgi:RNA recognition motif-containing protein